MSRASITLNLPFSAEYERVPSSLTGVPSSLTGTVSQDTFSLLMRDIAEVNQRTNGRLDHLEEETAELKRRADNIAVKYVLRCQYEFEISSLKAQVNSLSEMNEALTKRLDEMNETLTKRLDEDERMIAVLGLALTPS